MAVVIETNDGFAVLASAVTTSVWTLELAISEFQEASGIAAISLVTLQALPIAADLGSLQNA